MSHDPDSPLASRPRQDDAVRMESSTPSRDVPPAPPAEEGESDVTLDILNHFPAMFLIGAPLLYAVHVASGMPPSRKCTVGIEDMLALPALALLTAWLWFGSYLKRRHAMSLLGRTLHRLPIILFLGCLGADFVTHHFHRYFRP